jgi:membrane fusion protein, multidrug efflux system
MAARRRGALLVLAVVLAAALGSWAWWWQAVARFYESTENAYVAGNLVEVTPQVAGTVIAIGADDMQRVESGQMLVRLDRADAEVALAQAEAGLARAVREARTLYANNLALAADVREREAELARAEEFLARRAPLARQGVVSREELETARTAVAAATAALAATRERLAANRVLTDKVKLEDQPSVLAAAARVREAWLALARAEIPAPVAGTVARRSVQIGQRVAPGARLMAVVPLGGVWVEANFKEAQLRDMRIGQPATVTADLYGARVEYRGRVAGFAAGTGGAFALLPPQNATGNWIKVVQRVPVRIELDSGQLREHPAAHRPVDARRGRDPRYERHAARRAGEAAPAFATSVLEVPAAGRMRACARSSPPTGERRGAGRRRSPRRSPGPSAGWAR